MPRADRRRGIAWALALALAALAGCAEAPRPPPGPGPADAPAGPWRAQTHWLPVPEPAGPRLIQARLCRPPGEAPRPLAVINHGKSPDPAQRRAYRPPGCEAEQVRWFLERGFAVLLPVRRGYGASGGAMAEAHPACAPTRDYAAAALQTAHDIGAAIAYATALPGIRPDGVVVVGQSAGGLGAIALSSLNAPPVAALVNMAGGDGGHHRMVRGAVCEPEALVRAAARFGQTARTPMLWIYTANDSYFAPDLAAAMHRAYTAAGGQARLVQLDAWGTDGHMLFTGRGGAAVWGPPVEAFLGLKHRPAAASALGRP